jgi:hypothetical protein
MAARERNHQTFLEFQMTSIEAARAAIAESPLDPELRILERLLHALEVPEAFEVADLYELRFERFELALGILREWRLAQYYASGRHQGIASAARRQVNLHPEQ